MAKGRTRGAVTRAPHTRKARDASADKLRRLRGEEYSAPKPANTTFAKAVNMAKAPKGKKPKNPFEDTDG